MALTIAMLVSSLLGYVTLGCAVAAFIPLILTNAVKRRSGTGPGFLAFWLVADVLNLAGIILLGPQITQIFLAAWYFIADFIMLLQLIKFGHSDWPAPPSEPTGNFLAKQSRKKRPLWHKLTEQFLSFSVWDDIKLLVSCILFGISWWGIYLLVQVSRDPDYEVHHKTEITDLSFNLGLAGTALFSGARVWELISGWRRSNRNDMPEHSVDDFIWWTLIFENVFNLASIFTLSQDPTYLWHAELPWLLGGFIPIALDAVILLCTIYWQKKWKNSQKGQAYIEKEEKRQRMLDQIEEHKVELQEEWLAADLRDAANKEIKEPKKGDGLVGKYKASKQKAANKAQKKVRDDYIKNQSRMQPYHDRAEKRAQGLHGLPTHDRTADAYSSNSEDEKAPLSASLPSPAARSTRDDRRAADQSHGEAWDAPYHTYPSENPHGYTGHR